jgi:transposase
LQSFGEPQGRKAADVGREMGVSKHTIYAWKAKYGALANDPPYSDARASS